ncbi:MAG: hypothetical protein H6745_00040 [Deltaproteobacteria bacterium]|nr:hypothetical protein [Deltaproteobacteria bacterium]
MAIGTIIAEHAAVGRSEVYLLTRRAVGGAIDAVTAVIEREGRGFDGVYRARGLDEVGVEELREIASEEAPLTVVPISTARDGVARAVLMSRIAQRDVPDWIFAEPLLEGLGARVDALSHAYVCCGCRAPLPPEQQIGRARARGEGPLVLSCPACRAGVTTHAPGAVYVAQAWVRLLAGDPRRALVLAARAEGQRCDPHLLDPIRGVAMSALSNPVQAVAHLRRATERAPGDAWLQAELVKALAASGYLASATAELDRLVHGKPTVKVPAEAIRHAIAEVSLAEPEVGAVRAEAMAELAAPV